jgi:predicted Zn finger-like uncharacterized protein
LALAFQALALIARPGHHPLNFSCNKCQRRYSIADDKVRGKTVKVRCKNCQNVISVEGPPEQAEESTRVVSLDDVERLREQDRSLADENPSAPGVASASAGSTSWEDEPTRTMPVRDTRAPWFVMVKSKQEGPLDEGALRGLVASGAVTPRSYFWQQGMPDWKRAQDIPELAALFVAASPPPPPKASVRVVPPPAPVPEPEPQPTTRSATSWQPEPPAPSQTTWQPDPEPRRQAAGTRPQEASSQREPASEPLPDSGGPAPLGELFSDLDLAHSGPHPMGDLAGTGMGAARRSVDPLAALGEEDKSRPPVENTHYYVKKAGVDRRNPPWKIALFIVLLLAMPVGVLYALTELQVVPLRVTRVDAQGKAVQQPVSVFSAEGVGELKDLLLGRGKALPPPPPAPPPKVEVKPEKPEPKLEPQPSPEATAAPQPQGEAQQQEAAALYAEGDKKDVGPEVREETEVAATDSAQKSGPPEEAVARVVTRSQTSFKSCVEQALRRNPRQRTGKLLVTATVGRSGKVKQVSFDRADLDGTSMGKCIKRNAQRMVFPAFSGDDVEVEIPLVLSKSM